MRIALLVLVLACGHARATPLPQKSPPSQESPSPKDAIESPSVPADETHAPAPVDAQTMPPISRVFDNVEFKILLPPKTEGIDLKWTGYFLADGKKIPNTDFKIAMVMGRVATGSIAANKLTAPNKLPSSDVRLFSPRLEH